MTWSNNIKVDAIGLAAEVVDLRRELEQQATLLGKGSEREARLLAENAELQKENAALRSDKARLDWFINLDEEDRVKFCRGWYRRTPEEVKAAIDAARKEAQP